MISLDAMAEFLRQHDPNRDWAAAMAGFSQIGGKGSMTGETPSEPIVQSTVQPPVSILTSAGISPERESPSPAEPSEPSPTHQETDSMDIDAIATYYNSDLEEREARRRREQKNREGSDEPDSTPMAKSIPQEMAREEIDHNETAKKQGLMTDEEFEELLQEVNREEDKDVSEAVIDGRDNQPEKGMEEDQTREEVLESIMPQQETGAGEAHIDQEETVARPKVPEPAAPLVTKPKAVKRKLVLKGDPWAERPKPQRVSQRCLGKWTSSKAKANTSSDPVEIVSEEEKATPTIPGEESLPNTDLEDTAAATEVVSPMSSDQEYTE